MRFEPPKTRVPAGFGLLCCFAFVALAAAPALAGPAGFEDPLDLPVAVDPASELHVIFTADLYGRFAWPGCEQRATNRAELSHLVGAASRLREEARLAGMVAPVFLLGGSTIRPDILGNFVFGEEPELGSSLGDAFRRLAPDAVAVGLYDFGATPSTLEGYLGMLRGAKLSALAGNVQCERATDRRCALLGSGGSGYQIVQRGPFRIGVVSVVRSDLPQRVVKPSRGFKVHDPVAWSKSIFRELRERQRVDVIVVLANLNLEGETPGPVLDYVRALGKAGPELVITNGMFERASDSGYLKQIRRGRTVIVGTDRFGQHLGDVRIRFTRGGGKRTIEEITVRQRAVQRFTPDKATGRLMDRLMVALCGQVNQPLGRGFFPKPMEHDAFVDYLMAVMRKRTGAEIALLNDSGIADTCFPMGGRMTWEKLLRAIRTETHVGRVIVSGARLRTLLEPYLAGRKSGLRVLGVTKEFKVNGRKLIDGGEYRVALTRFIAAGGDRLIELTQDERFSNLGVELRDLATDFFGANGQASFDHDPDVSAEKDFPDLARRWLLFGGMDVGFSLSNVSIQNGRAGTLYSLPLLRRDTITTYSARLAVNFGATSRNHALELDGELAYGRSYTTPQGQQETTEGESVDRITASFLYKLRALKRRGDASWYVPEPYTEARLVTEFTASGTCDPLVCFDPNDRTYHYMDIGGTLGLGLQLHPLLFVKVGAVLRGEVLAPAAKNPDIPASPGIYLGYLLRKWKIASIPRFPVHIESRADFYFTDFSGELRRELTLASKLYMALTRRISLTAGHQLYVFAKRSAGAAWGNDISVGLALSLDFRRQTH